MSKVLITGAHGFLGTHVQELFPTATCPRHEQYDLTHEQAVCDMYDEHKPEIVIHLAADVGGLKYNLDHAYTIYLNNILINTWVIHYALEFEVKKLVFVSSACAYPAHPHIPTHEHHLWDGAPESSNLSYGITKRVALTQLETLHDLVSQGTQVPALKYEYLILANMYGPGDRSDHVIPDLIRKFMYGFSPIEIWGDGRQTRDFLYVKDAARAIKYFTEHDLGEPVNIATGWSVSIKDVAHYLSELFQYKGEIVYNNKQPTGQARRAYNTDKAHKAGWKAQTPVYVGLADTVKWAQRQAL